MRVDGRTPPYLVDLSRVEAERQANAEAQAQAQAQAQASAVAPASTAVKPAARAKVRSIDRVEISSKAREIALLTKEMEAIPEVRPDRVALAKQNMKYGSYRVDPTVLAQKMMESLGIKGDES